MLVAQSSLYHRRSGLSGKLVLIYGCTMSSKGMLHITNALSVQSMGAKWA